MQILTIKLEFMFKYFSLIAYCSFFLIHLLYYSLSPSRALSLFPPSFSARTFFRQNASLISTFTCFPSSPSNAEMHLFFPLSLLSVNKACMNTQVKIVVGVGDTGTFERNIKSQKKRDRKKDYKRKLRIYKKWMQCEYVGVCVAFGRIKQCVFFSTYIFIMHVSLRIFSDLIHFT